MRRRFIMLIRILAYSFQLTVESQSQNYFVDIFSIKYQDGMILDQQHHKASKHTFS